MGVKNKNEARRQKMSKKVGDTQVGAAHKTTLKISEFTYCTELSDAWKSKNQTFLPLSLVVAQADFVPAQVWHMANCLMLLFFSLPLKSGLHCLGLFFFAVFRLLLFGYAFAFTLPKNSSDLIHVYFLLSEVAYRKKDL
ncbi:hypothetical protein AVEN_131207-1 [Araneus ventricosus]|uniref:Uncharacterized protein n=1 Tax=Araneus ventricosus TaxID=182803 RepID=A0A4Y2QVW7_ARAVE|nr:hypothetical protein AVEN_131207-1 [Araneus ventricosus]